MASIVIVYGVVLAALSFIVQKADPVLAKVTFITGIAGGAFCLLCGIVAMAGQRRRAWSILTVGAIGFVLLSQVIMAWFERTGGVLVPLLLTFLMLLTFGILMYLLHGERPSDFYAGGNPFRDPSSARRKDAESKNVRRL